MQNKSRKSLYFALLGAGGYVAPRHMEAIKKNGALLSCAMDLSDSVGILDSYFPQAHFFTEWEHFERHVSKLQKTPHSLDFLSICTPNHLHKNHICFGLQNHMDVICEKPLVLNPWDLDDLMEHQNSSQRRIYTILQLRLHPDVMRLKQSLDSEILAHPGRHFNVRLTYITSRGNWYFQSWKGDEDRSGGIATNIGIHFFDMLTFLFGGLMENGIQVHAKKEDAICGSLALKHADVQWFLSINSSHLPQEIQEAQGRTFRQIQIGESQMEFSSGFENLHVKSYEEILAGRGFQIADAKSSINLVYAIRKAPVSGLHGEYHPYAKKL